MTDRDVEELVRDIVHLMVVRDDEKLSDDERDLLDLHIDTARQALICATADAENVPLDALDHEGGDMLGAVAFDAGVQVGMALMGMTLDRIRADGPRLRLLRFRREDTDAETPPDDV